MAVDPGGDRQGLGLVRQGVLSRGAAVVQTVRVETGRKTSRIDDCSVGGFNGACGSSEKLKVHAVDEMPAYIAWCLTNLEHALREVVGKIYGLKSAYKQRPSDRDLLRIAVWDPVSEQVRFLASTPSPLGLSVR